MNSEVKGLTLILGQGHLFFVVSKRVPVKESAAGKIHLAVVPWQPNVTDLRPIS